MHVSAKPSAANEPPVTLDLYVMSQCPFGVKAENTVFPVVRALGSLIAFNLYFIANETAGPDGTPGFRSLHGQPEVEENIRHLCAQKHFPTQYMDFILERNLNISDPGWQAAATKAGIDPAVIETCSTGEEGKKLLSENIKFSEKRQANSSPTIDINATPYRGSRSLKSVTLALCDALQAKGVPLPAACEEAKKLPDDPAGTAGGGCGPGGAAPAVAFDIQVITDPGCTICAPTLLDGLKQHHPKATVKTIAADSTAGKALITTFRVEALPFYFLEKSVEQEPDFNVLFASYYAKLGEGYTVRPGPDTYTPSVQLGRARVPRHLDVFVESLSPFAARMAAELFTLLRDSRAKHLTFSFLSLTQESTTAEGQAVEGQAAAAGGARAASLTELGQATPGALVSRRGKEELQESLRQACLFQHASAGDFFLYLSCRSQNLMDDSRADACLTATPQIQQCLSGGEGEGLLRQDAALARELGLRGGPALLWENRYGPFGWHEVDWKELIEGRKQ